MASRWSVPLRKNASIVSCSKRSRVPNSNAAANGARRAPTNRSKAASDHRRRRPNWRRGPPSAPAARRRTHCGCSHSRTASCRRPRQSAAKSGSPGLSGGRTRTNKAPTANLSPRYTSVNRPSTIIASRPEAGRHAAALRTASTRTSTRVVSPRSIVLSGPSRAAGLHRGASSTCTCTHTGIGTSRATRAISSLGNSRQRS